MGLVCGCVENRVSRFLAGGSRLDRFAVGLLSIALALTLGRDFRLDSSSVDLILIVLKTEKRVVLNMLLNALYSNGP